MRRQFHDSGRRYGIRAGLTRLKQQLDRDRVSIVSAGVAFYMLLSIFPLLGALISIYGLMFDPRQVTEQLAALKGVIPEEAMNVLLRQLQGLTQAGRTALSVSLAVGVLVALWSAASGVKAMMEGLNAAYGAREKRGFIKRTAVALFLTLSAIAGAMIAIGAVVVLPAVVRFLGLSSVLGGVISYARWPILAGGAVLAFAILYRYGPSRDRPPPAWITLGAVVATALWMLGSVLFSWYVSSFANYSETYGAVAAIVILLMWFLVSAYALLIGAEIDAGLEQGEATPAAEWPPGAPPSCARPAR